MKTVLVCGLKGGCGKSLISASLARFIADQGHDCILIDADIDSPNIAEIFQVQVNETLFSPNQIKVVSVDKHLDVFSMGYVMKDEAVSMSGTMYSQILMDVFKYARWNVNPKQSIVIVDCPAGASDIFRYVVNTLGPTIVGAVVVGVPNNWKDVRRMLEILKFYNIPVLGLIENFSYFVCPECEYVEDFSNMKIQEIAEENDIKFLGRLPYSASIRDAVQSGFITMPEELVEVNSQIFEEVLQREPLGKSFLENTIDALVDKFAPKIAKIVAKTIKNLNSNINFKVFESDGFGGKINELIILDKTGKKVLFPLVFTVKDGRIEPIRGKVPEVHYRIIIDIVTLVQILIGKLDVKRAILMGKIHIEGSGAMARTISLFEKFYESMAKEFRKSVKLE